MSRPHRRSQELYPLFILGGSQRSPLFNFFARGGEVTNKKMRFYILLTAHTSLEGRGHVKAELRIYQAAKRACQEKEKRREKEEKDGKDG